MAIVNEKTHARVFSQTLSHMNSKNQIKRNGRRLEKDVSMDKSKAGTKEKESPDGLNYPTQNTIIINIIC